MARPATGSVRERRGANGTTYAIRFRAYGRRHQLTLGSTEGGWTRARAEAELIWPCVCQVGVGDRVR